MSAEDFGREQGKLWAATITPAKCLIFGLILASIATCARNESHAPEEKSTQQPEPQRELQVEYTSKEVEALVKAPVRPPSQQARREILADDLLAAIQRENPNLNHMKYQMKKEKGGYELMIVHDFFNKYTLSAGGTDGAIQGWIGSHASVLKEVGITRVGVWGTGKYSSGAWYDLTK